MNSRVAPARAEKRTSLSTQTLYVQNRLAQWTKSGRKHWDLYRWLIDPKILAEAARLVVENDGAAGLDDVECSEVKGREWQFALRLSEKLRHGAFRPGAVRRVYIPKKDGRKRPLGIPNIEDRVVQRALVLLLEPVYEQVFLPCSYGFRPGKSAVDCVAETAQAVYRHRHVLEADIESFFDRVSHRKLLGMLREKIVDPRVLDLIRDILKAGFQEVGRPWQRSEEGTPQGGPLSPLLANVYLHYALDLKFQQLTQKGSGARMFRYADDFVILSRTKAELKALRRSLMAWMREAKLSLKKEKTRVVDLRNCARDRDSHFDFLGYRLHLRAFKDNPRRYWVARQPSEKARKTLRENLRGRLVPNLSPPKARSIVKAVWVGWSNYFRYGNSNRVFYREPHSVKRAVWRYLRRKYRSQRRPVPWRRLIPLGLWIVGDIRPVRVIPDSLRQKQVQPRLL